MLTKLGIYVHIPFCESKCDYCNFVSFKSDEKTKEQYVFALIKEMLLIKDSYKDYIVDTIFIGGGTPTCLRDKAIKNIVDYIINNFNIDDNVEITIEANPNSLTLNKLREFKLCGVNRLSIGLQAYDDRLLKLIGRIHTANDFDLALKNAKEVGFENINVDLLLGLPTQTLLDVKKSLKHLVKNNVKHISCYGLIVEDNTKLCKKIINKEYSLPTEEQSLKMYDYALKYLSKKGINRYEVSNFAKQGYECKHNLKYWNMHEYVGFGVASHSFCAGYRWENTPSLPIYFECIKKGKLPRINAEEETLESLKEEFIMTELRKQEGIDLKKYENYFGEDLLIAKQNKIAMLLKHKLINYNKNYLYATNKGFEVINQIILELI